MCRRLGFSALVVLALGLIRSSAVVEGDHSLIGWWTFDDAAGTVARDASGRGNNGALRGDPTWVIGRVNGALQFDGVDDYVHVGSVGISGTDPRTVVGWVKASTLAIPSWTSVFGFVPDGSIEGTYFDVEVDDAGNYVAHICGDQWILGAVDTQWHHVGGTYGGGAGSWYLDGQLMGAAEGQLATIDHVRIGARLSNGNYFPGLIDDIRIYNRVLTEAEIQSVMNGTDLGLATDPSPAEWAEDVPRDAVLTWIPDPSVVRHNVYFGTKWDDVHSADAAQPRDVLVGQGQTGAMFDPDGLLEFGQTYYWRVDGVGAAPDNAIFKGRVWSFTCEPFAYPVAGITASASHADAAAGPENTVNGSGMDAEDRHSVDSGDMWLACPDPDESVWINYEFDRIYKLHQMMVWNYNGQFEWLLGLGLKDVTIEYSCNDGEWVVLGDVEFAQAIAGKDYTYNTIVDFGGVGARCVRLMVNSNFGTTPQYGLSEVRFLYVPTHARRPVPENGATDIDPDIVLSWRSGREATSHEVYFGTDPDALPLAGVVGSPAFSVSHLDFARTYYWQVVEVNEAETVGAWASDLWTFSTQTYRVFDDFESYTDDIDAGEAIFDTWVDGWVNETGSTVGHLEAPFAEQTIVHSGLQSMPFRYDNSASPFYAEAERRFAGPQDWTVGGADTLSLYFHGDATNAAQPLYVTLGDSDGQTATVIHEDAEAVLASEWQQWRIPLSEFAGVMLDRIEAITIGVGSRTNPTADGTGTIYIDDIGYGRSAGQ